MAATARDCGDGDRHRLRDAVTPSSGPTPAPGDGRSGRHGLTSGSTSLYEAIVPGTEVVTGTTFGWADEQGAGGQSSIYYVRYDGATGTHTAPRADRADHRRAAALSRTLAVDAGTVHALWWDTRNDVNNDATTMLVRPPGNDADGNVGPSFDVFAATRPDRGGSWTSAVRAHRRHDQRPLRAVRRPHGPVRWRLPVDRLEGATFGIWTDWRNTVRRHGSPRDRAGRNRAPTSSSAGTTPAAASRATRVRATAGWTRTSTATSPRSRVSGRPQASGASRPITQTPADPAITRQAVGAARSGLRNRT